MRSAPKPSRKLRAALGIALGASALAGVAWLFHAELGNATARPEAAVILTAPVGYRIAGGEAADRRAAAGKLLELVRSHPREHLFGVRFASGGGTTLLLADTSAEVLDAREAGASGTRLRTTWKGDVASRLAWCRSHGDFDAPALPPPEQKNLYH
jgi:hypothetical protein